MNSAQKEFLAADSRKGVDRRGNIPFNKYITHHFKLVDQENLHNRQNALYKKTTKGMDL
jgi:hypothetical protein